MKTELIRLTLVLLIISIVAQTTNETTNTSFWDNIKKPLEDIWNAIVGGILSFVNALKSFGEFLWAGVTYITQILSYAVSGFQLLGRGLLAIVDLIGKSGDPNAYFIIVKYATVDNNCRVALSNCSQYRLSDLAYVNPSWKDDQRTVCDVIPTGAIGFISTSIYTVTNPAVVSIVVWLAKNFIIVWLGIAMFVIAFGMERSIKQRDMSILTDYLILAGKILVFPFKMIWKLIELIMKLIQTLAQFISAIKPI